MMEMTTRSLQISSFCKTGSGTTPSRSKHDLYYGGGIPWVKSGELRESIISETEETVTQEALAETSLKLAPKGAILVAMYGANVGRVGILGIDATTNQAVCHIVPEKDKADSRYIFHALQQKLPEFISRSVGGAQPNISQQIIRETEILLPPIAQQKQIAAILDKAEELRALRRKALGELDAIVRSVFLEMFGDPVTNPKRWERKSIKQIGQVVTGNTPPRVQPELYGNAIEWIKSDNINTPNHYLTKASEGLSELGKAISRTVPPSSIIVTCIAGTPDCIGNAAIADREVAFNQQINALVPVRGDFRFLYAQILVNKGLIQQASTSSMKGMVSKSRFEEIKLIFPPPNKQEAFGELFDRIERLKTTHRESLTQLDALFASLQHRAFRGEL